MTHLRRWTWSGWLSELCRLPCHVLPLVFHRIADSAIQKRFCATRHIQKPSRSNILDYLGQSWNRLEGVLKRSWAGFDAVSDRLGSQDGPKDPQGDTKDAPKRRHVGPGSAQDASRCHHDARKGDGEAQKY